MFHPSTQHMQRAIELAKENIQNSGHGVGAVVVCNNEIISEAVTTLHLVDDPTAHAEINAIRFAARRMNSRYLEDCYLYTTFEPCPMCCSAAIWAKMSGIVCGASMDDQTASHPQRISLRAEHVISLGTPQLSFYPDFMREECTELLSDNAGN